MLKKLTFAPFFIIFYIILILNFKGFLGSFDSIFSLSSDNFIRLLTLSSLFCLTSLSFTSFVSIASDWKLVLGVSILTALTSLFLLNNPQGIIITLGSLIIFAFISFDLMNRLKSYSTFNAATLLGPSIRTFNYFLILVFSIAYFLSINQLIKTQGFQVPDSLIEATLKFTPQSNLTETNIPSIPQDQLDLLKNNPQLLKQSGLDPKILDSVNQAQKNSNSPKDFANNLIKETIRKQFQDFINPYIGFIAIILSALFFFTVQSLSSLINLLVYPLLWIIFYILEKIGFIKYTQELSHVKKLTI